MTRRETRIALMQILYSADINGISIDEAKENISKKILTDDVLIFLHDLEINLEKIDSLIVKSLENYTINRLNLVDKSIIRIATLELLSGLDKRIVINEALEITKEFSDQGDKKAVKFNNRLLDNISKNI